MITKTQTKDDIKKELSAVFEQLDTYLKMVDDASFQKSVNGKWSIAQNIDHLTISNFITTLSLNTPKFILKQAFNTNNRTNWNYDEVVWKYQRSLGNGAKASLPFQPRLSIVPIRGLVERLWKTSENVLLNALDKWSEKDLDTYILPHPIMGKITVRELLFFTIYHVQHHLKTIKAIK